MTTALELITKYTPFYPEAKPCFSGKYHIGYWLDNYEDGSPVQKGDTIDDYLILDINRQNVVIKKGTNIYKAGVGERFNQNMQISGAATYSANGTRHYVSASDEYTSASDVEVRAVGRR